MRELVDVVPAELLGEEARHAGQPTQLRELAGVSKGVGQPEGLTALPKVFLEKALAVHELTDKRLAAGQVSVVLNPAAANGVELAILDLLLDTLKDIGVQFLEPLVLLGLGAGKVELGIPLHQIALVGP